MPADFHIETGRKMVFSKAVGVLGLAEVLDHMERLLAHPDFRPEFNQLMDFREVTEMTLSHAEIRQLALRTIFSPTSMRAFVVKGDLQFGIGRMFTTYREFEGEIGIVIFKEMKDALAWLSLEAEPDSAMFAGLYRSSGLLNSDR